MATPSTFLGTKLNLDAKQAATLTLTCSLIGMVLNAAMYGKVNPEPVVREFVDISRQAMSHPNKYNP